MNERIRELMIQSNPHGDFKDCEWVFEKFALLIVRECANRIDYWESRQGEHSDDLLKHFGVEG
jgi:hypothetical protein